MAINRLDYPIGHVLSGTEVTCCIWDDYGSALVYKPSHGLTTGQYVYIKSNVSNYNGFWYVVVNNGSSFYLRESASSYSSNLTGVVDTCTASYQVAVMDHYFQSVHLPIVYKTENDLWPVNTNSSFTSRTISSIASDNGLVKLTLSGSLGTFYALDYIKISSNTSFTEEVYQIVTKTSSSIVTINKAYTAGMSTSGTVLFYPNNYFIRYAIYGGLNSNHYWQSKKPFTLISTIDIVPNEDNIAVIDISKYLKEQISVTENSTLSPYLPNNLDFFTQFYVVATEYYDSAATGTVVSTSGGTIGDSTVYGSAINSMLPFKNIHSGHLSEYIYGDSNNLIKFLTTFDPVLFTGEYFDISFINNIATTSISTFRLKRDVYIAGVLKETFYDTIGNRGEGIYRQQISQSGWSEDRIDLTLQAKDIDLNRQITALNITNPPDSYTWLQSGNSWQFYGEPGFSTTSETRKTSYYAIRNIYAQTNFVVSTNLSLTVNYTGGTGHVTTYNLYAVSIDSSGTASAGVLLKTLTVSGASGSSSYSGGGISFTVAADYYVGLYAEVIHTCSSVAADSSSAVSGTISALYTLTSLTNVSETKTITVKSDCASQSIYLGWLNHLGGFEYWKFTARKDYNYVVEKANTTEKNIYTNWPNSYGEFANSVKKQISRTSRKKVRVRSQYLTSEQLDGIKNLRFSPLVQVVTDQYSQTNVIVDTGSFKTATDAQDLNSFEFGIEYTDNLPSQAE